MTTNKPHIEAYLVTRIKGEGYGKPRRILDAEVYDPTSDSFFAAGAKKNNTVEPLVSLSKYEVLQAECETLVEALQAISRNELDAQRAQHVADVVLTAHRKGDTP